MRIADLMSSLLLAAFGIYAAVVAWGYGVGKFSEPGAGFFPFISAALMVGCALVVAFRSLSRRTPNGDDEAPAPAAPIVKLLVAVGALAVYTAVLPIIGFPIATFLVLLALAALDDETSWTGATVIAAVGTAGFWLVFAWALEVSFPPSLIGL